MAGIAGLTITTAALSGCYALGAVMLANPIGAAGGAIYGISCMACSGATLALAEILIPTKDRNDPTPLAAKIITSIATGFFGGWKLAALFGINMSLKSAAILQVASIGAGLVVNSAIAVAGFSIALVVLTLYLVAMAILFIPRSVKTLLSQ